MRRFAFLFAYLFSQILIAQDKVVIDSLNKIIVANIHDSIKVERCLELAGNHYANSPQAAIVICEQALILAENSRNTQKLSSVLGWLAYLYEQTGDISKALFYNKEALELAQKTNNKQNQATLLNNIAAIYKDQGNLEKSLEINAQSLKIKEEINDTNGIATTYNNIGLILQGQGKIEDALDFFAKALSLYEKIEDSEGIAVALQNIGALYKEQKEFGYSLKYTRRSFNISKKNNDIYNAGYALNTIGGIFEDIGNLDSALHYYQKALSLRKEINDIQGEAYSLKNIASVFEKLNKFTDAKSAYEKSLTLFKLTHDKWGEAKATNCYGSLLLAEKNFYTAETHLIRSLNLARQLGYPADIRNAAGNLQKLYREKKEWKRAFEMYDLYVLMHDSVENDMNRKAAIKTQFRYEYEKKEALLKSEQEKKDALAKSEIKRQKIVRNSFVGGFTIMLLFAAVFFTQRNRISKEKKRSEELLLNILPSEVAEELKHKGYADAKLIDEVTVLFTDFKGFTEMSEKLSPQELVKDLNECFSAFDLIMEKYGMEKIKTIGDSYMAAGGLPTPNTTHASDAIKAAMEMRDFIAEGKKKKLENGQPYFEIRIGIHTGPVVAGIVGVKKFQYDIWGDTVNTASRMESSGETGKINISETTYKLVKDKFICEYRGKIEAKGKGKVKMYFVA